MKSSGSVPLCRSVAAAVATLTVRQWALLIGGATSLLLFLFYMLPADESPPVEIVSAPSTGTLGSRGPTPFEPDPSVRAGPVPPSVADMTLHGVMGSVRGGVAMITVAGNDQRVIPVGREFMPGLRLKEIGLAHAVITGAGGDVRLELKRFSEPASPASTAIPSVHSAASPILNSEQARNAASLEYRLGLAPRKVGGRTTGFQLKSDANLPILAKAGLRPGDVIVAVNGQAFESEEKVIELRQEIAGSYTTEFEFERGGKRMTASVQMNPRPSQP